jgi:hypothetical protein
MRRQKWSCVCPAHPCAHNRFTPFIHMYHYNTTCKSSLTYWTPAELAKGSPNETNLSSKLLSFRV